MNHLVGPKSRLLGVRLVFLGIMSIDDEFSSGSLGCYYPTEEDTSGLGTGLEHFSGELEGNAVCLTKQVMLY